MKKIMIGAFLVLLCLAGVEIALLHNTGEAVLPELSEKMKEVKFDNPSVAHHYTNISVNGKNYTELSFVIEEGYARIISLKTEDSVLHIPSRIGQYDVLKIGGQYFEIPEAEDYARENKKTPMIGRCAWMGNEAAKYEKIVIEKGIRIIYAESFRGVKADVVEFPESLELIGAMAFAESEISEVIVKNPKMCQEWGVFNGTKHEKEFPESSLKGREESYGEGANKTHLTYTIV